MTTKRDYYEVLGVTRESDGTTIKASYRKLAIRFHPDRNPDNPEAEDKFKEAAEAYEVLSNTEKRQMYNQYGHDAPRGSGFGGFGGVEDVFSQFGDIFGDIFGGGGGGGRRRSRSGPARGADLRYDLELTFEEAALGLQKEITLGRSQNCEPCSGSGAAKGSQPVTCQDCGGRGQVVHNQGIFMMQTTCPRCQGQGKMISNPCKPCSGSGQIEVEKDVSLKIPAGVDHGNRMRVGGEGEAGAQGGPRGDLYVFLHVQEHDYFHRDGADVVVEIPVSYVQAALGTTLEIKSLHGKERLEIPSGTQPSDVVKLRGKGIENLNRPGKGDMLVVVKVSIPKKLHKKERELLEQIAADEDVAVSHKKSGFFQRLKDEFAGE